MSHFEPIEPEGAFQGLRPRAVLRGFIWDNVLTIVSGLILASMMLEGGVSGVTDDEIDAMAASTDFALLFLPLGLACTVLGGFIAGSRAGTAPVKNGLAVGAADIALGLLNLAVATPGPMPPLWIDLLGFGLTLPAAAAGGALARRAATRSDTTR